ncbi:ABC transporter ATP-binding protein [Bdellovibrionota bacterium FG-1]
MSAGLCLYFTHLRRIRPWAHILVTVLIVDLVISALDLLVPMFSRLLFDYSYPLRDISLLNVAMIGSVGIFFIKFILDVLAAYLEIYVGQEFTLGLQKQLFSRIQGIDVIEYRKLTKGDYVTRITGDTSQLEFMTMDLIPVLIANIFHLVSILYIAFTMNPLVTWLALCGVPLYFIEVKVFSSRVVAVQEQSFKLKAGAFDFLQERLRLVLLSKLFCQEKRETEAFHGIMRRYARLGIKERILQTFATFSNSITVQLWTVGISWFLGYQIIQGQLTIGEFVSLTMLLGQIGSPIKAFINTYTSWRIGMLSIRRVDDVLNLKQEQKEEEISGNSHDGIKKGVVEFRDVSFGFNENIPVLKKINLKVVPGKMLALVGPSGAGKSTLVNLILRFYKSQQGKILIDEIDINEFGIHELRKKIGYVTQECHIISGTIQDNIAYGQPDASVAAILQAAEEASAMEFISKLPDGLQTMLESGEELSGGQKQRITLARVLLLNPEILLFDEVTSALDPISEYRIQEVMTRLARTKTVLVIAHRLSTIRNASMIVVLSEGQILELGTFHELISKKGEFFRLHSSQFGGMSQFISTLEIEHERAFQYGTHYALAVIRHSTEPHPSSPSLPTDIEWLMIRNIHLGDNIARWTEDLFLLLMPGKDPQQAHACISQLLDDIHQDPTRNPGMPPPIRLDCILLANVNLHPTAEVSKCSSDHLLAVLQGELPYARISTDRIIRNIKLDGLYE